MNLQKKEIEDELKALVLARFKTLNPDAKISLGENNEVTVKEIMEHVKNSDDFGKKVVQAQIRMIKVLSGAV